MYTVVNIVRDLEEGEHVPTSKERAGVTHSSLAIEGGGADEVEFLEKGNEKEQEKEEEGEVEGEGGEIVDIQTRLLDSRYGSVLFVFVAGGIAMAVRIGRRPKATKTR